jgi:hypothetical protein
MLKTKARTVSMARLPSEELQVRLLHSECPTLLDASSTSKPVHLHSGMYIHVDPNRRLPAPPLFNLSS